jgi:hypothetical protein
MQTARCVESVPSQVASDHGGFMHGTQRIVTILINEKETIPRCVMVSFV